MSLYPEPLHNVNDSYRCPDRDGVRCQLVIGHQVAHAAAQASPGGLTTIKRWGPGEWEGRLPWAPTFPQVE